MSPAAYLAALEREAYPSLAVVVREVYPPVRIERAWREGAADLRPLAESAPPTGGTN